MDCTTDHNIISNEDMGKNKNDSVNEMSIWLSLSEQWLHLFLSIKASIDHGSIASN